MTLPTDEELRALVAKATPGPWEATGAAVTNWHDGAFDMEWMPNGSGDFQGRQINANAQHDAALIVAAVNVLPDLLKRLSQAEGERDQERDWKRAANARAQSHKDRADRLEAALTRIRDYDDPTGDAGWHDRIRQEIARSALTHQPEENR